MYYDLDDLKVVDEDTNIKISLSGIETIALARHLFGSGKFYWSGYGEIDKAWMGTALMAIATYRQKDLSRGEKATATRLEKQLVNMFNSEFNRKKRYRENLIDDLRNCAQSGDLPEVLPDWKFEQAEDSPVYVVFTDGEGMEKYRYLVSAKLVLTDGRPTVLYHGQWSEVESADIEEYARLMHEGACKYRNARNARRAQERAKAIECLEAIGVSLTAEEVA